MRQMCLTDRGLEEMADFVHTTFSSAMVFTEKNVLKTVAKEATI